MIIWQTKNWKNLVIKSNQASKVIEIDNIFFEKRSIWIWEYWLFALWVENLKKINFDKLIELCKKENCLFVQVESFWITPPLIPPQLGGYPKDRGSFKPWHYKKFITPYTALIDLSKSLEEILAEMKPKWRYNINLATKKWVEVFEAEKTEENIKIFYDLMIETTSRDGFFGNNFEYYKNFLETIPESSLIFTKFEDKILSAWIFIFDKEISIYYYWASTSDKKYRNLMAPYLMQWFAIQKAKEVWSKFYDFLWIATPWEKNSSLAWVTDFKLKFTSDIRKVSESYIFINKKCKYFVFKMLKKIKSKF